MCLYESEINQEQEVQNQPYAEGIYFDMPEEEYHEIPYFSRSTCETMIFDPTGEEHWYNSPMNPDYVRPEPTSAMELGSALHCMLLEPERFDQLYVKKPTINDMTGKIVFEKSDEIKHFLKSVGEKVSGNKPDLIQRAIPYLDPETHVIWDNVLAAFYEDVEANGRRVLSEDNIEVLEGIRDSIEKRKKIPELLNNIRSEITIIWKDEATGIMCKCRLDGARPEAIIEVKSFSTKGRSKSIERVIKDTFNYDKYNLQYLVYWKALKTIIKKVRANKAKVFGSVNPIWLKEFLKSEDKQFFILFCRTQAPYQCKSKEAKKHFSEGASSNVYFTEAEILWNIGISSYKFCVENDTWIDQKEVDELTDEDVPSIMYQSSNI